jgi:hypothetical protein
VELEAAGWGTRVTLTAVPEGETELPGAGPATADEAPTTEIDQVTLLAETETEAELEPEPVAGGTTRRGWLTRLFRRRAAVAAAPAPEPAAEPEPEPEPAPPSRTPEPGPAVVLAAVAGPPPALSGAEAEGFLSAVLDDLGAAHHRPFSR